MTDGSAPCPDSAPRPRYPSGDRRAGFTLVEVMVAFAILALLTIAVQRGVISALGGTARAQETVQVENIARTLLMAPLDAGATALERKSGRIDGYAWTMDFDTAGMPMAAAADGRPVQWQPARVIVSVEGQRGRGLVVETVRLVRVSTQ